MPDNMRIEGLSYPDDSNGKSKSVTSDIVPIRLRHFIWMAVLAALGIGVALYGTPHLRYIYTYTNTYEQPYYVSCDYVGWNSQRIIPRGGHCPLITLLKSPTGGR